MKRRNFVHGLGRIGAGLPLAATGAGALLAACGGGGNPAAPGSAATAAAGAAPDSLQAAGSATATNVHLVGIQLDPRASGVPISRAVLGSSVQWSDNGDNMLHPDGTVDPTMLATAATTGASVLRYPGGTQSDVFHWDAAQNQHVFTGAMQPTTMDTQHLLELCETLGADPLFQVNLVTGSVDEAQRWVRATNVQRLTSRNTGRLLPAVSRWELGNEPYLQNASRPDLDLTPAAFAARVNSFAPALRAIDPTLRLGLPLTTDRRNGVWVTPYQGFTRQVLGAVKAPFDFACLHNAYMPYVTDGTTDTHALYCAAMAGAAAVADDLAAMRALLAELRPGQRIPLAITEWAPLFSIGRSTDPLILSPAGALYAADLLRMLAMQPDVECANHWSLSGNWLFGAVSQTGFARAIASALQLTAQALVGERLAAQVTCDVTATPSLGQVTARPALPLIEVLPTRAGNTLRVLMIHKDLSRPARVTLDLGGLVPTGATLSVLRSADPMARTDVAGLMKRTDSAPTQAARMYVSLPPHSIGLLTLTMPG